MKVLRVEVCQDMSMCTGDLYACDDQEIARVFLGIFDASRGVAVAVVVGDRDEPDLRLEGLVNNGLNRHRCVLDVV